MQTDALFVSMTLPQLVLVVISGSLTQALAPLLAGQDEDHLCILTGYKPQRNFKDGIALFVAWFREYYKK